MSSWFYSIGYPRIIVKQFAAEQSAKKLYLVRDLIALWLIFHQMAIPRMKLQQIINLKMMIPIDVQMLAFKSETNDPERTNI